MAANRLALFVPCLMVFAAMSGCLEAEDSSVDSLDLGESQGAKPKATVQQSQEAPPPEAPVQEGFGDLMGRVLDTDDIPVKKAYVGVIGTNNHTYTDNEGYFGMTGVKPGNHKVRIDAPRYESLEESVVVDAGLITRITVNLVPKEDIGFRDHIHDLWAGATVATIFDGQVRWTAQDASGQTSVHQGLGCTKIGNTFLNVKMTSGCYNIPVPLSQIVYPGAKELTAKISWKTNDYVKNVKLEFRAAGMVYPEATQSHSFTPGQTKTIPLQPHWPDNGHARFTGWSFDIIFEFRVADTLLIHHPSLMESQVGPFTVKLEIHKGEIGPEPPHKRYWEAGSRLVLVDQRAMDGTTALPVTRDPKWDSPFGGIPHIVLGTTLIVPPGTTRLNVTLDYKTTMPNLESYFTKKTIAFRTAEKHPSVATYSDLRVETPLQDPIGKTVYSFPVKGSEVDAFYQTSSYWLFLLANKGQERGEDFHNECGQGCGKGTYTITIEAINENWMAEYLAGKI